MSGKVVVNGVLKKTGAILQNTRCPKKYLQINELYGLNLITFWTDPVCQHFLML